MDGWAYCNISYTRNISSAVEEPAGSFPRAAGVVVASGTIDALLRLQAIQKRAGWVIVVVDGATFVYGGATTAEGLSNTGSRAAKIEAAKFVGGSNSARGTCLGGFEALADV